MRVGNGKLSRTEPSGVKTDLDLFLFGSSGSYLGVGETKRMDLHSLV